MTWTYEPAELPFSSRDVVRTEIGDTIESRPLLTDEQIAYLLDKYEDNTLSAAIDAAELIAINFGNRADKTVGRLSISFGRQQDSYEALAARLRRKRDSNKAVPLAGGLGPVYLGHRDDDYWNVEHNITPPHPPTTLTDV